MKKHSKKGAYYISLIILLSTPLAFSHPPEDEDCSSCHSDGNYTIQTNIGLIQYLAPNTSFVINITATGEDVHVWIHPQARDNNNFSVHPTIALMDNDHNDLNPSVDEVYIIFNLTTPIEEGMYKLLVHAQSPDYIEPHLVFLEFTIYIDEDYAETSPNFLMTVKNWIQIHIFSHMNIYLGMSALICLGIGTILMEVDSKFIKTHGRLATIAFILTSVNIYFTLNESIGIITYWIEGTSTDWVHLTHFIIGIFGYCAGLIGLIQGLAGHPMKKYGYIALASWSFNFIFGIIYWGVGV